MATKAEKEAAKAAKQEARAEKKAEKEAVKAERSELARIDAAQKAEINALKAEGVKGKALSAERKANTAEYKNAENLFSASGRQTLLTGGQPRFFSNAATYSGTTADGVNQRLQTAASKYDTLGIADLSMAGKTKVGLGLDKLVRYDLGKAGQTATTTIQRAEKFVGNTFTPEQLQQEGIKVKEVKGAPGLFRYKTGSEGNNIYTFFRKDADGNFVGTGVNRTATPQDDGGFFGSDLGKALMIAGSIALTFTPGGQAFAGSLGSFFSGGSLVAESLAAQALGNAVIRGVSTGVITGDAEKGLIAGAISAAGSALNLSGELGNVFDSVGLGDYKDAFGVIGGQASEASTAATNAIQLASQGFGADQIASNLVAAGVDPAIAQNAASLALQGGSASSITSVLNSQGAGGISLADLGIQEAGEEVITSVSNMLTQGEAANLGMLDGGGATVPNAFNQAVESALGGGSNLGQFGNVNAFGFGTTLPTAESLVQSLISAGISPGTAANIVGTNLAGVGGIGTAATGLIGTGAVESLAEGVGAAGAAGLTATQIANLARTGAGLLGGGGAGGFGGGAGGGFGGLGGLNLGNLNLGGMLGAGIDLAALSALQQEATGLGRQLGAEAAQIGREAAVPFTPYTVTTGAGTGTVTPGAATATAAPAYEALRQQQLGLAGQTFGAINPAQAAQTLYAQAEALTAPGRAREQERLLGTLGARGLLGIGRNLPTVGGGVAGVNPYLESLLSAQETARARQALEAQQFGTQEATRQAALGQGLVGGAQAIDQQALASLNAAAILGQQERALASRNAAIGAEAALKGLDLRSPYERTGLYFTGQALTGLGGAARGMLGLPTEQGNVGGNFSLGNILDIFKGIPSGNVNVYGAGYGGPQLTAEQAADYFGGTNFSPYAPYLFSDVAY